MGEPAKPANEAKGFSLASFLATYSTVLSSFVIGLTGLVATTLYQSKQQEIARRQSESQIEISKVQAENQWKITRAEILSKNLNVLSNAGPDHVGERYGVLLSLTRGSIIDPELAVSYALELGNLNPDYMASVLHSVQGKSYVQLEQNFFLPCERRYGTSRALPLCKNDHFAGRSQALSELLADELVANNVGALSLLQDERHVQNAVVKLGRMFEVYLDGVMEKRQFQELEKFEGNSAGARLVAAFNLVGNGAETVASGDEDQKRLYQARKTWLEGYMVGRTCDAECKSRLVDFMLTDLVPANGGFDQALKVVLEHGQADGAQALGRLHSRLLWCQVDQDAQVHLRDRLLVPLAAAAAEAVIKQPAPPKPAEPKPGEPKPVAAPKVRNPDEVRLTDVLGLLALVPEPGNDDDGNEAWDALQKTLKHPRLDDEEKAFAKQKKTAAAKRARPAAKAAAGNFCSVKEDESEVEGEE